MKRVLLICVALLLPSLAQAATVLATDYDETTLDRGTDQGTANGRDNPNNIIDGSDTTFYELGKGGSIDLLFGGFFTGPIKVVEVTFGNNPGSWPEAVEIYAGLEGVFGDDPIGTLTNVHTAAGELLQFEGLFDSLRLLDVSPASTQGGGADIASVRVGISSDDRFGNGPSPVPLPAAAWLFLSAVGGGALLRRRKAA